MALALAPSAHPDAPEMLQTFVLSPTTQGRLLASLAVVAALWLARRIVLAITLRHRGDAPAAYRIRKFSQYVTVLLGILIIGRIWFEGLQSVATFFGLLTAGLAVALKDLVANLAGWVFILFRRPFEVGDRIQVGEHAGDVIDLRIFQFTLMEIGNWVDAEQSTGRVIHIPNGKVLAEVVANYSKGFEYIWNEIPVLITFESNWKKAKARLERIAVIFGLPQTDGANEGVRRASGRFLIASPTLTPTVYTTVQDSGVCLTIRYLCEPRERRGSTHAIWEEILDAFAQCDDIDFAYPSQRFYYNAMEGKSGARSSPTPGSSFPGAGTPP